MKYLFEDLKDAVVIVTGSGRGIGKAIAELFAEYGSKVVITDIDEATAKATAEEIAGKGGQTLSYTCDVAKMESVESMVNDVVAKWGKIDVLVNNAGITMDGMFLRMKSDQWQRVIDINLTGTYNCTFAVVQHMRKTKKGAIVNISSIAAHGNPGQANYSASKAGVIGFTKALGKELAPFGIRVNAVAPGFVQTAMTDKIPEKLREQMLAAIPMRRPGQPIDIARVVLFLASELSSYITAAVIDVNGGIAGL
ncbi:MAG: 3-oxoacyl-ACP reductase FabG [Leptospiraceae bacterium]|nr:3-oxoacyl-ACP reductase FabG [Leptospiraceae bacterium]MDW8306829.1 3-oxoacyl-ACP reductase FabG [Leptospiraceae bacterium]